MQDVGLRIDANYPGGNIKLVSIDGNRVRLEQDLRDTMEWWFYWGFRAQSAGGGEIIFDFANGEVVGPWGPAVSADRLAWEWLGGGSLIDRCSFRYVFRPGETIYFAFSLPYQAADLKRFLALHEGNPALSRKQLTSTRKGRPAPLFVIGDAGAPGNVICTARHHACESTASYVLEGAMRHLLADEALEFRRRFRIHVVPFVDLDGVEEGDQGKSRAPHDHNRDYIDQPIYETTAAIMKCIGELRPTAGIDLHSPFKWGERHDYPYFVKQAPPFKAEIERLGAILKRVTNARGGEAIRYDQEHDIEMGEEWNQPGSPTCGAFLRQSGARLACGFEVPYFGIGDQIYTAEKLRSFGADFAAALIEYLGN